MITTLEPILSKISNKLNENSNDTSAKRISAAVDGVRMLLTEHKFAWTRKPHTLALTAGVQEYDLSDIIEDYNPLWGLYQVWVDGVKVTPDDYDNNNLAICSAFFLTPDNKSIKFSSPIAGTEDVLIWYYATFTTPSVYNEALNISIPEDALEAVALAGKAVIHGGKRQRYDERNALIDYQAAKEKVVMAEASNKARDLPKRVPAMMRYLGFRRTYDI